MIPAEYSIRGPHGTVPWVAIVDRAAPTLADELVPMLVWARTRDEAESYVRSQHRNALEIRMYRAANPNHHLGNARVVELSELA